MGARGGDIPQTLANARKDDYLSTMTHALLGFGFGMTEVVIILVVALLIFGPSKLPQLGEGIGKMLRGFKKEMKGIEDDQKAAADSAGAIASDKAKDDDEIDVTPKKEKESAKDDGGDEEKKTG
jgi:sec-independent protein translocase protein TatA